MSEFDHERLDVYVAAIDFVALVDDVVEHLPRGRAYLADQLQRAATSIPLNIAEGVGEFSTSEKARFYRRCDAGPDGPSHCGIGHGHGLGLGHEMRGCLSTRSAGRLVPSDENLISSARLPPRPHGPWQKPIETLRRIDSCTHAPHTLTFSSWPSQCQS